MLPYISYQIEDGLASAALVSKQERPPIYISICATYMKLLKVGFDIGVFPIFGWRYARATICYHLRDLLS